MRGHRGLCKDDFCKHFLELSFSFSDGLPKAKAFLENRFAVVRFGLQADLLQSEEIIHQLFLHRNSTDVDDVLHLGTNWNCPSWPPTEERAKKSPKTHQSFFRELSFRPSTRVIVKGGARLIEFSLGLCVWLVQSNF